MHVPLAAGIEGPVAVAAQNAELILWQAPWRIVTFFPQTLNVVLGLHAAGLLSKPLSQENFVEIQPALECSRARYAVQGSGEQTNTGIALFGHCFSSHRGLGSALPCHRCGSFCQLTWPVDAFCGQVRFQGTVADSLEAPIEIIRATAPATGPQPHEVEARHISGRSNQTQIGHILLGGVIHCIVRLLGSKAGCARVARYD